LGMCRLGRHCLHRPRCRVVMLSEATEDRLRNVFANHPAVRAVYVFGSVAADPDRWEPTDDKVPFITDCMEAAE